MRATGGTCGWLSLRRPESQEPLVRLPRGSPSRKNSATGRNTAVFGLSGTPASELAIAPTPFRNSRRTMALLLTKVLTNPAEGVPAAIEARRALWPVVLLSLSTAFAGASFALRWNAAPSIIKGLEASGQLKGMPEADLLDQIQQAERLKLVTSIAGGLVLPALTVLGIAVALALLAWLLGKKGSFSAFFTAAAVGMLPLALARFLYGLVALVQTSLSEDRAATLLPSSLAFVIHAQSPKLMRLFSSLDFFQLWAALLVGVGFAAVVGMRRRQGLLIGALLFVAQLGVFGIGLPALAGGGGR